MVWYIIAGVLFAIAIALLISTYIRDRRYERLKPSQAMSDQMWEVIQQEREENLARREKFQNAIKEAERKETHGE